MNNELEELRAEIRKNRILLIIILALVSILFIGFVASVIIVARYIQLFKSQIQPIIDMASKLDVDSINRTISNIQKEIGDAKEAIEAFKENFSGLFKFFGN